MNQDYVQGFMDKCAAAGIDPEALVKQAINWTAIGSGALGVAKKLNPMNVFKGGKGLLRNFKAMSTLKGNTSSALASGPMRGADLDAIRAATKSTLAADPVHVALKGNMVESGKELAGGLAGTGAIAAGGYAAMPDRRPPTLQERIEAAFARLTGR